MSKILSPLRHKGSPPLLEGKEHDEWHQNYSTIEDSPKFIEEKEEEIKKTKQAKQVLKKIKIEKDKTDKLQKEKERKKAEEAAELERLKIKHGKLETGVDESLLEYRKIDFAESGVLKFDDFNNILLGPKSAGLEMQRSPFGIKASVAVGEDPEGEFGLTVDLEEWVEKKLTKIHKGKVIDGHTFTFSSGKFGFLGTDWGDYLQIQKIDENGNQVDEIEIPLGETSNLSTEKQHEMYVSFMYPKYDKESVKESIVNTWDEVKGY